MFNVADPAKYPENKGKVLQSGLWSVTLVARHRGPVAELPFQRPGDLWPEEEVWVFEARPDLRMVEVEGGEAVDPQQTTLPADWRDLPAYRLRAGESLRFREVKRGDPDPAPDRLALQRDLWLRFDGGGYSVRDTITGVKSAGWRLEALPSLRLGRVAVDGSEQFITRRAGAERARSSASSPGSHASSAPSAPCPPAGAARRPESGAAESGAGDGRGRGRGGGAAAMSSMNALTSAATPSAR